MAAERTAWGVLMKDDNGVDIPNSIRYAGGLPKGFPVDEDIFDAILKAYVSYYPGGF